MQHSIEFGVSNTFENFSIQVETRELWASKVARLDNFKIVKWESWVEVSLGFNRKYVL
jgi:hypothetical protein